MEYNILNAALCENNVTEGNVTLPYVVLYNIADFNDSSIVTLSGSDVLVLEFDLGQRIHIDRFEYKFVDSSATQSAVASGISFYFKDESFESYYELTTQLGASGVFYTTLSGSPTISGSETFAPRYLKMKHDVSGTFGGPSVSGGYVYGLRAINNDTIVDFGIGAEKEIEYVDIARGAAAEIRSLAIYNSGETLADALIHLEPTYTDLDEAVSISLSASGPWIQVFDEGTIQINSDNFDHGSYSDTEHTSSQLHQVSYSLKENGTGILEAYGMYTSPVLRRGSSSYARIIINKESNREGHIAVDDGDPAETVEIRYNNTKPATYAVIRELYDYYDAGYYRLAYRDRWLDTTNIKESSTWYFASCSSSYSQRWKDYGVIYDQVENRWAGWLLSDGTSPATSKLYFYNNLETTSTTNKLINTQTTGGTPVNFIIKEFLLDYAAGIWTYFYSQGYSTSSFVDATGYYLVYFDSSFNTIVKLYTEEQTIGALDVVYDTKDLWYTLPDSAVIQKLGIDGVVSVQFEDSDYTDDLGGLAVLPDGNVVFGNGTTLHFINYNGQYLEDYAVEDAADESIGYIAVDGDGTETLWILDGLSVGLLYISGERKGEYAFKLDNIGYPVRMTAVTGGVWVQCTDSEVTGTTIMRFISKENRRVDTEFSPSYSSLPALIYQDYTNINYVDRMPLSIDSNWYSLAWQKIATESFLLPEDNYYQIRITLRRQKLLERYPTSNYIIEEDQDYPTNDNFDLPYATPSDIFWGTWYGYPELTKVYVNTSENKLFLKGSSTYTANSFISTYNVTTVGVSDTGFIEVIINYKIGAGNGVATGRVEHLYIKLENAMDTTSYYLRAELNIPSNAAAAYSYLKTYNSSNSIESSVALAASLNYYEGELRIYINQTSGWFTCGRRNNPSSAWTNTSNNLRTMYDVYSIKIESDKNGSDVLIDSVYVNNGAMYPYTDSPQIISVHEQAMLELNDIYPNTYKNIYLKTFVSKDASISSNANMDVKAMWKVSSY